ncbi:hypothetical protein Y032_0155g3089 [Ancylostoma ceylanicum]|uniref:Cystatin domain-containing protein n=1 Tax=Ancylostoma ceylanicum TaxID=53326 RepID=A0A016SZN0_9BILA|nr:hypothetical protein Y032_0155g3089 [Ancylostoma ceylanicum]
MPEIAIFLFLCFLFVFSPVTSCTSQEAAKNVYLSLILTSGILEQLSEDAAPLLQAGRAAGSARSEISYRLRVRTIPDQNEHSFVNNNVMVV